MSTLDDTSGKLAHILRVYQTLNETGAGTKDLYRRIGSDPRSHVRSMAVSSKYPDAALILESLFPILRTFL